MQQKVLDLCLCAVGGVCTRTLLIKSITEMQSLLVFFVKGARLSCEYILENGPQGNEGIREKEHKSL